MTNHCDCGCRVFMKIWDMTPEETEERYKQLTNDKPMGKSTLISKEHRLNAFKNKPFTLWERFRLLFKKERSLYKTNTRFAVFKWKIMDDRVYVMDIKRYNKQSNKPLCKK